MAISKTTGFQPRGFVVEFARLPLGNEGVKKSGWRSCACTLWSRQHWKGGDSKIYEFLSQWGGCGL